MSRLISLAAIVLVLARPSIARAQDVDPRVIVAAAAIAGGVYAVHEADQAGKDHLGWSNRRAADWLSYGTVAGGLVVTCAGKAVQASCLKREGLRVGATVAIAETVKHFFHRERPDASDQKSFFSEHTALACVGGFSSKREVIGAALCASTAYLRVAARRHWVSDVATGAGVGFAISRIAR